jgi:hypothetical protein
MLEKIRYWLFWRKYKNRLNEFTNGMPIIVYSIAPNSFKISWQNYQKLGCKI